MYRSGRFGQGTVVASSAQVTCRGVTKYSVADMVDCFGSVWSVGVAQRTIISWRLFQVSDVLVAPSTFRDGNARTVIHWTAYATQSGVRRTTLLKLVNESQQSCESETVVVQMLPLIMNVSW